MTEENHSTAPRAFKLFFESLKRPSFLILREFLSFKWLHLNGTRAKIAIIILAAGSSKRMGDKNKLLIPYEGVPIIRHVAKTALASRAQSVTVVLGHQEEQVHDALKDLPLGFISNPHFADGLASSLRVGILSLQDKSDGALIMLGDMPTIDIDMVNHIIRHFNPQNNASIIVPHYNGKHGNPILWAHRFFDDLSTIKGDKGGRDLIKQNRNFVINVDCNKSIHMDIDTQLDLMKLYKSFKKT